MWTSSFRLRHLTFFKAVADTGSFTAAALHCNVAQPTLSAAISQFEEELGAQLFERTTRRVTLTRFGRSLLPLADVMLANVELAARDVEALVELERQTVRIAAVPSLTNQKLPLILRRFAERYQGVRVTVYDVPNDQLARLVRDGKADLGVGLSPFDPDVFEQKPLFDDRLVVVCGKHHRFYSESEVPWSALRSEAIATFGPSSNVYRCADKAFSELGMPFRPETYNYRLSVLGMAANDLAVAILPSFSLGETMFPGLRQVPLVEPVVTRQYNLIQRKGRRLLLPARLLAESIIGELASARQAQGGSEYLRATICSQSPGS
jgi:LysR family carnitine catabolism transcriptional activator